MNTLYKNFGVGCWWQRMTLIFNECLVSVFYLITGNNHSYKVRCKQPS